MKTSESRKTEIKSLVDSLLSGLISAEDAIGRWPSGASLGTEEERLRHEVGHFAADADIRAKDAARNAGDKTYEEYQMNLIRKCLAEFLSVK
jgi:hypothetical protein